MTGSAASSPPGDPLHAQLCDFQSKVNEHPRLRSLLRGWDRRLLVSPREGGTSYRLTCADSRIVEVASGVTDEAADITVRGDQQLLVEVFSGGINPAMAFLAGTLEVFASDADQVKLDAITLVLWD